MRCQWSNNLLFYVNLTLKEIFGTDICRYISHCVGDFFQLPSVAGRPVYEDYKNAWQNFESFWKLFKKFKLTWVMKQHGFPELSPVEWCTYRKCPAMWYKIAKIQDNSNKDQVICFCCLLSYLLLNVRICFLQEKFSV